MMVKAERMVGDIKVTEIHEQSYKNGLAVIEVRYSATHMGYVSSSTTTEDEAIQQILAFTKEIAA